MIIVIPRSEHGDVYCTSAYFTILSLESTKVMLSPGIGNTQPADDGTQNVAMMTLLDTKAHELVVTPLKLIKRLHVNDCPFRFPDRPRSVSLSKEINKELPEDDIDTETIRGHSGVIGFGSNTLKSR